MLYHGADKNSIFHCVLQMQVLLVESPRAALLAVLPTDPASGRPVAHMVKGKRRMRNSCQQITQPHGLACLKCLPLGVM